MRVQTAGAANVPAENPAGGQNSQDARRTAINPGRNAAPKCNS